VCERRPMALRRQSFDHGAKVREVLYPRALVDDRASAARVIRPRAEEDVEPVLRDWGDSDAAAVHPMLDENVGVVGRQAVDQMPVAPVAQRAELLPESE